MLIGILSRRRRWRNNRALALTTTTTNHGQSKSKNTGCKAQPIHACLFHKKLTAPFFMPTPISAPTPITFDRKKRRFPVAE
jgi:hypothetical protein